jgi:hypothetical protein
VGKQSRAKRKRRRGRRKTKRLVALSRAELAAAAEDQQRAAIHRHLVAAGVWARVQAVVALMKTEPYVEAQNRAISQAELGPLPPRNEEDVRAILLDVLKGEPFNADLRDVLLKVRVDHETKRLSVSAGPGLEAVRAAIEVAPRRSPGRN